MTDGEKALLRRKAAITLGIGGVAGGLSSGFIATRNHIVNDVAKSVTGTAADPRILLSKTKWGLAAGGLAAAGTAAFLYYKDEQKSNDITNSKWDHR